MYCSSCGSGVKPTLSYCNHCGAKLKGAKGDGVARSVEVSPESLVFGIIAVFVFGIGAIIGLMVVMKEVLASQPGLINFFTMLSFLLMLVIEGVFIGMLLSRRRGAQEVGDAERLRDQAAKELGAACEQALSEPVPSVSEHTTRSLEPALPKQPTIHQ